MSDEVFRQIVRCQERGTPCVLATIVGTRGSTPGKLGAKLLVSQDGTLTGTIGGGCVENEVREIAHRVMASGTPVRERFKLTPDAAAEEGLACGGHVEVFIEPILAPSVYVFGAGHIGAEVAHLAARVGFRVVVLDDRPSFANAAKIPDASEFVVAPFETMLGGLALRPQTYVVIVTRGHKHDATCLRWALTRPVSEAPRYVGMISSRTKRKFIYKQLAAAGVEQAAIDAVHAPIGLAIGAVTPAEIAVSVVAQLIAVRRTSGEQALPEAESAAREDMRESLGLAADEGEGAVAEAKTAR